MPEWSHDCPGGCGAQVARRLLACKPCWFRLPKPLRDAIRATYGLKDPAPHRRALRDASIWYRDNPEVHRRARPDQPEG